MPGRDLSQLRGSIVPMVTPFHNDGAIDETALVMLINWRIESGSHGLFSVAKADLSLASLIGADLSGADLNRANLKKASLLFRPKASKFTLC